MANEKNQQTTTDQEQARRKKEEQSRNSRRRSRQFIGLALSILIMVGVVSIVRMGVGLVQNLTDNTELKKYYEVQLETMVMFDALPFKDPGEADQGFIKQAIIWHIFRDQNDKLERNELEMIIVPTIEVDIYASNLFGPNFRFEEHASFREPTQHIDYTYDEKLQAYVMPITSPNLQHVPTVVEIVREAGGVRRVVVGYVATQAGNELVQTLDYEHPVRYMDYLFRREGSEYYLFSLEKNTANIVSAASLPNVTEPLTPMLPGESVSASIDDEYLPEVAPSVSGQVSSSAAGESSVASENKEEVSSSAALNNKKPAAWQVFCCRGFN